MQEALYNSESLKGRILDYDHKAKVLRRIHSNKLARTSRWNNVLNFSTITVSAFVTFFAYFGITRIHDLFLKNVLDEEKLGFLFNVLVLILLIASFLQITLSLGEKSLAHLTSVRLLTEFLTDLDDLKVLQDLPSDLMTPLIFNWHITMAEPAVTLSGVAYCS